MNKKQLKEHTLLQHKCCTRNDGVLGEVDSVFLGKAIDLFEISHNEHNMNVIFSPSSSNFLLFMTSKCGNFVIPPRT